jgi:hypothetical protein
MIVRGIEESDLRAALEVANYAYRGNLRFRVGPEPIPQAHQLWRIRLGVKDLEGPGCRRSVAWSWWERSWWDQKARHVNSACYHAHRDFLYALFERAPYARAVTALALYEGLADFEARHQRVGGVNVGSYFEPVRFEDCCDCLKKCPWIEAMVPEPYLGEYTLEPERAIYSDWSPNERQEEEELRGRG